jgi:hypothetical protein
VGVRAEPINSAGACRGRARWWTFRPTTAWGWWDGIIELEKDDNGICLSIELTGEGGAIWLSQARVVYIEYEPITSHPLANPPLPYAYPPPRLCRDIVIAGDDPQRGRRLAEVFADRWPTANAGVAPVDELAEKADALLFDVNDAAAMKLTWAACLLLAERRVVVMSWPALQGAFRRSRWQGALRLKTIRDPEISLGRVTWANFITRSLALDDALPLSWTDAAGESCLRCARRSQELAGFCEAQQLRVVLRTDSPFEATCDHPFMLARHRPGEAGALVVMDFDGVLESGPSRGRAGSWFFLLANALGADHCSLGQFATPADDHDTLETEFRELIRRYPGLQLMEPKRKGRFPQLVVGQPAGTFGLPPRPALVIRTGRAREDWPIIYGLMLWLKRLSQEMQRESEYARHLLSRRRIVILPLAHPERWSHRDRPLPTKPFAAAETDVDGPIDAVLDLSAAGLPQDIRVPTTPLEEVAQGLRAQLRRTAGRTHLSVSLPPAADETGADSIRLTDRAASLAEQFTALQSGWAVMNRGVWRQRLRAAVPVICPAEMTVFDHAGAVSRREKLSARDGHVDLVLEPGWGLTVAKLET